MTRYDWQTWLIAIARPCWIDNEEAPKECELVPGWYWRRILENKFGKANVVWIRPRRRLELPDVLSDFNPRPSEEDWCAVFTLNGFACCNSCEDKQYGI